MIAASDASTQPADGAVAAAYASTSSPRVPRSPTCFASASSTAPALAAKTATTTRADDASREVQRACVRGAIFGAELLGGAAPAGDGATGRTLCSTGFQECHR